MQKHHTLHLICFRHTMDLYMMKNADGVIWKTLYGLSLQYMDMYVTLAFRKDQKKARLFILKSSKYCFNTHICSRHTSISTCRAGCSPTQHNNRIAGCHSLPDIAACTARLPPAQRLGEDRATLSSQRCHGTPGHPGWCPPLLCLHTSVPLQWCV